MFRLKEIERYVKWQIENLTYTILDYEDDDAKGNAEIIAGLFEERECWKDILRIMIGEETYMDYKD